MAERTISTKLAIDGEQKYKQALQNINSSLRELRSELKLVESQYKGNSNSIEALTKKGEALKTLYDEQEKKVKALKEAYENAKKAVDGYKDKGDQLKKTLENNKAALEKMDAETRRSGEEWAKQAKIVEDSERKLKALKNSSDDTTEAQKKLEEKIRAAKERMAELEKNTDGAAREAGELVLEDEKLNRELEQNDKKLDAAQRGMNDWQTKMNNAEAELNDLDREIKENDGYMEEAKKSTDGCAKSIDEFGEKVKTSKENIDDLAAALSAVGLQKAFEALSGFMSDCMQASIEFESAMAGVAKTTDLTDEELEEMGTAIKDLTTTIPLAATEFAGIAEAAGQLGVAKEDLISFSTTMGNLGVATNMTAEEAATMLAQFAAVTGMDASDYDRLGSTIVDLGNNFATTEQSIVNMVQRFSAAGADAGLAEREMLALAAAVASVGIRSERGGTNLSKLISKIQLAVETGDGLEEWARGAGLSAEEFGRVWADSPIKAIQLFIQNVDEMDQSVADFLYNDLGIHNATELNLIKALVNAEEKTGLFTRAIDTANTAWKENIALQKEAETRYQTTESKLQLLENNFTNLKIAIGDQLTPVVRDFADIGSTILGGLTRLVEQGNGIVPMLGGVTAALGALVISAGAATIATTTLGEAFITATAALVTNPIFLATAAISGLAAAMYIAAMNTKDEKDKLEELRKTYDAIDENYTDSVDRINATADAANNYIDRLSELEQQGNLTKSEQHEYNALLSQLQTLIPDLNLDIDEQTGLLKEGAEALRSQTESWRQLKIASAIDERRIQYEQAIAQAYVDQYDAIADRNKVERDQKQNEKELIELHRQRAEILGITVEGLENMTEAERINATANNNNKKAAREHKKELEDLDRQISDHNLQTIKLKNQYNDLTETIDAYDTSISEAEQDLKDFTEATEDLKEESADAAEEVEGVADAVDKVVEAADKAYDSVCDLVGAYKDSYEAAKESLDGQYKLWDKVDDKSEVTLKSIKEAQQSQADFYKSYSENLQNLLSRDIPGIEVFSTMFTDMSADSAAALAALSKATDEEIADIISTIQGTDQYKGVIADLFTMNDIDVSAELTEIWNSAVAAAGEGADYSTILGSFVDALQESGVTFEGAGEDIVGGVYNGIISGKDLVITSADDLGDGFVDALREFFDMHSPSKVTEDLGKNVDEGFADGIDNNADMVTSSAEHLGTEFETIMNNSARKTVDSFITELNKIQGRTSDTLKNLRSTIRSATSSYSSDGYSVGQAIASGMASGISSKASAIASAARKVVQGAIAAAKAAAAVKSPSRKTMEIFENVGEGMIVGLKNKEKELFAEMDSMTNQAMDAAKKAAESNTDFTELYNSISYPKIDDLYEQSSEPKQTQNITFAPEINIYPNEGQSAEEIADYTIDKLTREWDSVKAVFA